MPPPFATKSAGNPPEEAKPPKGFLPTVPQGFQINMFAAEFKEPRWLTVAPNGDIFLADTHGGKIYILRDPGHTGGAQQRENFSADSTSRSASCFTTITSTSAIRMRFCDTSSTRRRRSGSARREIDGPSARRALHSRVGVQRGRQPSFRQRRLEVERRYREGLAPSRHHHLRSDGKNARLYATGLRNPVGIALEPTTGQLWTTVNERDGLGDDLPPDYFTSVKDGGFYGWPYSYIGDNVDPRVNPQKPELVSKAIVPDVLLGSHRAPLQFAFYTGKQFPASYQGGVSWRSMARGIGRRALAIRWCSSRLRMASLRAILSRS